MLTILFIIVSILWLWLGVRLNFLREGALFGNTPGTKEFVRDVSEIKSREKTEIKIKLITTLVLISLGIVAYIYNDQLALFSRQNTRLRLVMDRQSRRRLVA